MIEIGEAVHRLLVLFNCTWTRVQDMLDLSALAPTSWLRDVHLTEERLWAVKDGRCAVGVVLLAEWDGRIAVVRKEPVKGYEFSGKLALPGGIVRGDAGASFTDSFEQSLLSRAQDEAGLEANDLGDVKLLSAAFAPVSRYSVKGAERFTVVLAARATVTRALALVSTRQSIHEAFFAALPLNWEEYAPANRLILAYALARRIPVDEQRIARLVIDEALSFCNEAAAQLSLPLVDDPWQAARCG